MTADRIRIVDERVSVSRTWLKMVRECLQGDLPRGRIGDAVFLLRDQIDDLLADPANRLPPTVPMPMLNCADMPFHPPPDPD